MAGRREREEVNGAIADSLADIETGRTEPFFESQDRFRGDNPPEILEDPAREDVPTSLHHSR